MLARVAASVEKYGMFAPGQRVGVAVSGGADSVCLLHVLIELAPRWELALCIVHVDHGLRGEESEADARFVRELGERLGLEVLCHETDVRRISLDTGDNLEQAARRVRQGFFLGLIQAGVVDRVALGHTRSDQAETVLFRFLRGAGTAGLAGIRPVTADGLVRPLIEVGRAAVVQFLTQRGIPWREDSSNQDRSFARNRIRHELLPALEREWNPALAGILAGVATVAQDEEEYWRAAVDEMTEGNLLERPPAVLFRAQWLAGLHPALARRVGREALRRAKGDLRRIDLQHVEQLLELARSERSSGRGQVPGLDVLRSFDWVRLAPAGREDDDYDIEAAVPGRRRAPGTGWEVVLELLSPDAHCGYNEEEGERLDWGRIPGVLRLRNWRPGDEYRPLGSAGEISVKSLFREARVPLWERRKWPVLTCEERIVWVAGFGPETGFAATADSHSVLSVHGMHDIPEFGDRKSGRWRLKDRSSAGPAGGGGL
jgi:tRNA(Ile)-lysidine synthase